MTIEGDMAALTLRTFRMRGAAIDSLALATFLLRDEIGSSNETGC